MPITFSREDIASPERLELVLRQIAADLHTLKSALPTLGPEDLRRLATELAPEIRNQLQATGVAPLNLQSLLPLPPESGLLAYVYEVASLTNHALVLGGDAAAKVKAGPLGTATTVLHGAAAGDPTYSAVVLTTDVSGTLPIANGGTAGTTAALARASLVAAAIQAPAGAPHAIPLAKVTGGGVDGSITITAEGTVSAFVDPT